MLRDRLSPCLATEESLGALNVDSVGQLVAGTDTNFGPRWSRSGHAHPKVHATGRSIGGRARRIRGGAERRVRMLRLDVSEKLGLCDQELNRVPVQVKP